MKVLAVTPMYPPRSRVGAWLTTHAFLSALVADGHTVDVVTTKTRGGTYTHEGVSVHGYAARTLHTLAGDADLVVSHLGDDGHGALWARKCAKPLVRVVHTNPNDRLRPDPFDHLHPTTLAVFSSEACRQAWGWDGPSTVIHPPIDADAVRVTRGEVAQINLSEAKGGDLFWDLTRRMPDVEFLGVVGGYGTQMLPMRAKAALIAGVEEAAPNVKVLPTQPDPRTIYARTRVLLVPSTTETYCRVAVEAMCSGIPVIAHPSPGIREACGDAAIWCDRGQPTEWVDAIEALGDPTVWARWSATAAEHAADLPDDGPARFAQAIYDTQRIPA